MFKYLGKYLRERLYRFTGMSKVIDKEGVTFTVYSREPASHYPHINVCVKIGNNQFKDAKKEGGYLLVCKIRMQPKELAAADIVYEGFVEKGKGRHYKLNSKELKMVMGILSSDEATKLEDVPDVNVLCQVLYWYIMHNDLPINAEWIGDLKKADENWQNFVKECIEEKKNKGEVAGVEIAGIEKYSFLWGE